MKSSLRTKPQNDYKQGSDRSDVLEIFPGCAVEKGWKWSKSGDRKLVRRLMQCLGKGDGKLNGEG